MSLLATAIRALVVFVVAVSAQLPSGIEPCCSVDPSNINDTVKATYCAAEQNTCRELCDISSTGPTKNTCDEQDLTYSCVCGDGLQPNMSDYQQTVPAQLCLLWFADCFEASGQDLSEQEACRAVQCGNKTVSALASSASTSSSRTSRTTTSSASSASSASAASTVSTFSTTKTDQTSQPPVSETGNSSLGQGTQPGTSKLSSGAKAGIAIGAILGVVIIALIAWFLIRRRKGRALEGGTFSGREPRSDEKQVVVPTAADISNKPELSNESSIVQNHGAAELHSSPFQPPYQTPSQVYLPEPPTELQGSDYNAASLPSPMNHIPPYAPLPTHSHQYDYPPYTEPQELHPRSPAPTTRTLEQLSPEAIAALQEEEQRIDAEMEEVRRMKELREQKFAIQQKLREAKRDIDK